MNCRIRHYLHNQRKSNRKSNLGIRMQSANITMMRRMMMLPTSFTLLFLWSLSCNRFSHGFSPVSMYQASRGSSSLLSESSSFNELGLTEALLRVVEAQDDWESPTATQSLIIPSLLGAASKRQYAIQCEAPTGSGKTAAYALPLWQRLVSGGTKKKGAQKQGILSVILVPTRELAIQVGKVMTDMARQLPTEGAPAVRVWYGGTASKPQVIDLYETVVHERRSIHCVVATPGRFADVVASALSLAPDCNMLESLEYLVIDEADRLLGNGFENELNTVFDLFDLSSSLAGQTSMKARSPLNTWLFSATFPERIQPRVDTFWQRLGHHQTPLELSLVDRSTVGGDDETSRTLEKRAERKEYRADKTTKIQLTAPISTIDLRTIRVETRDRTQVLRHLLAENEETWDRVLVFVGKRYTAEHVSRKLQRLGIRSAPLHGKLDQEDREKHLEDFQEGRIRVLIATDVASRGLDVAGLPAMINYDLPRSSTDFVHRVGRTGRAGNRGCAVSFITPESEAHWNLIEGRHLADPVSREVISGFEPDEDAWQQEAGQTQVMAPGTSASTKGLAHDRMFGGVKGRKRSKKDKLREQAARDSGKVQ